MSVFREVIVLLHIILQHHYLLHGRTRMNSDLSVLISGPRSGSAQPFMTSPRGLRIQPIAETTFFNIQRSRQIALLCRYCEAGGFLNTVTPPLLLPASNAYALSSLDQTSSRTHPYETAHENDFPHQQQDGFGYNISSSVCCHLCALEHHERARRGQRAVASQ